MRLIPLSILAAMLLFASSASAQEGKQMSDATTLEISAQVDVKAEPDVASITAGVMTSETTAEAAMKENATRMNAIFKALKEAKIAEKDIQTSGININAQYNYEERQAPKLIGYQANNNVTILIRDLQKIGSVIDALVSQGANQMNGPNFTLENPEEILDSARKEAVNKARRRAELYATAVGMKVKRIRTLSESINTGGAPPYPMMAMRSKMADTAESTPVASGQVALSVAVNISFELAD